MQVDDLDLQSAYTEADKHTWTKVDLDAYEYARMRETDDKAEKMLVEQKAKQEGKIEVAKNLISLGSDNNFIIKATGLGSVQKIIYHKGELCNLVTLGDETMLRSFAGCRRF